MISPRYPTELKGEGTSNNDAIQSKTRLKLYFKTECTENLPESGFEVYSNMWA